MRVRCANGQVIELTISNLFASMAALLSMMWSIGGSRLAPG